MLRTLFGFPVSCLQHLTTKQSFPDFFGDHKENPQQIRRRPGTTSADNVAEQVEQRLLLSSTLENGVQSSAAIGHVGDVDSYTFQANAGDNFIYAWARTTDEFTGNITVFQPNGEILYTKSQRTAENLTFTDLVAGTYTITVSAFDPDTTGQYQHTLAKVPGALTLPADEGSVLDGQTTAHSLTQGDIDLFTFQANAGDSFRYAWARTTSTFTSDLTVFDPQGEIIFDDGQRSFYNLTFSGLIAGTYTIAINAFRPDNVGQYQHTFAKVPGALTLPADEGAFVNGQTTAHSLTQGDLDLFTFQANAGDSFQYAWARTTTAFTGNVTVFNPDGEILYQKFNRTDENLTFTDLAAGTYTVVISATQPTTTGGYQHTLAKIPGSLVLPEDEGAFFMEQMTTHSLVAGDIDLFTFEAETGDSFTYDWTRLSSTFLGDVTIYDPTGEIIYDDGQRMSYHRTFTDLIAGTYTIAITAFRPANTGSYEHKLQLTSAVPNGGPTDSLIGLAGNTSWWAAHSDGESFTNDHLASWDSSETWLDVMSGDFNGDGATDVAARRESNGRWILLLAQAGDFVQQHWGTWSSVVVWEDATVGDFNGDGRDDIAGRANGNWWISLSTGFSFTTQLFGRWSTSVNWQDVLIGDFNHDGHDDIAGRANGSWWVSLSTGSSFQVKKFGRWSTTANWQDVLIGDFNRDGRDDIAGRSNGTWWVSLSTGSRFSVQKFGKWSSSDAWQDVSIGDFNGDGRADIAGRIHGNWWISLSTGTGFTNQHFGKWSTSVEWHDATIGDFDGDGRDDIAGRANGNWWVSLSTGSSFSVQKFGQWATSVEWQYVTNAYADLS